MSQEVKLIRVELVPQGGIEEEQDGILYNGHMLPFNTPIEMTQSAIDGISQISDGKPVNLSRSTPRKVVEIAEQNGHYIDLEEAQEIIAEARKGQMSYKVPSFAFSPVCRVMKV